MNQLELRRQLIHFLYGPLIILLHKYGIINNHILLGAIIAGGIASYLIKHQKLSLMARILSIFERAHHMEKFPGRGILFFTIGAYFCLMLFDNNIAYAGIMVLSAGDAFTNIVGRHFGKVRTRLNPDKYLEGTFVGIAVSIPAAYYFVPNLPAAISAAVIAMFLEMPHVRLFGFEIDDNLVIPLAASFTLNTFLLFS